MNDPIYGGQGREPDDVVADAMAAGFSFGVLGVVAVLAIVAALMGVIGVRPAV
jgi:malonyl CoA-acyl carrier protein transacylase